MHRRRILMTLTAALTATALASCTIGDAEDTASTASPVTGVQTGAASPTDTLPDPTTAQLKDSEDRSGTADTTTGDLTALAGRTIYIDPGHAGTAPPADLTAIDGRGGTKACNTSGTASDAGWPEHTFTWEISQQLKTILEEAGATVLLTRADDVNRADCIDERAYKENASAADAVVSLHADGSGTGNTGFHISAIADPLPDNLPTESADLATSVRDAMVAAGLPTSNYLGTDGLYPRSDLTGLNLSSKPKILIEFGNMRDLSDLAQLESADGRKVRAQAVAQGLADFLS
ncbi:N-acetylmuramoyl-L-alanine amidase [Corynebacterium terpenotabidum]|uniref:N-acetylmuramoyl-L-alanine amidase n=1 Tax=Corynebacterium terpenotabidum Y-11 TaxID=1200352 RepID=S4XFZ7_9CORY|nr:N-acetylmuramoyl-L-alanine amidase [Corynebacterium terpenotabidum]AGP31456.1 N-acetylmuramoyl-L-alanine amidase [Corynebacterium terpenotabidum Y-11]